MDVLGLENLTTVRYALDMIYENEGLDIDLDEIDFEDQDVYKMLSNGDVSGVFQIANQSGKVMEQKPTCFNDLIAINALIRPGVDYNWKEYIERRHGKKWSVHKDREHYMTDTSGLMVYQEQFLLDCQTYAGWGIAFADKNVRKNKDIKNDKELENKFVQDSISNGYEESLVREIWEEIKESASKYSFNKSHATSYGVLSYKTAWLKCHYPIYWYASLLNSEIAEQDKVEGLIAECKKKGIQILPPDVNKGSYKFEGTRKGIRIPINYLKGVGEDVVKYIKSELIPITSLQDMLDRGVKKYIKKNVVEAMIKAGIFDFENEDREYMMWSFSMTRRKKTEIKNGIECPHQEYNEKVKLQWEREVYGMYLSAHPLDTRNARSIADFTDDMVAVQVIEKREVVERLQRNGKPFAFLMGSNQHGMLKCLVFADIWAEEDVRKTIEENEYLLVKGKKSGLDLIVNHVEGIEI